MITNTTQVLLLQDSAGAYYAVPVQVVQACRVSDELRDAHETTVGGAAEVQGYGAPTIMGGMFEIKDFSFDIEQTLNIGSQSTGAGAGKARFNPFSITRNIDVASPNLFR
jgi:hypothetical protein